jgi:hypothetical protein
MRCLSRAVSDQAIESAKTFGPGIIRRHGSFTWIPLEIETDGALRQSGDNPSTWICKRYAVRQDLTVVSSANFRLARDPLSYEAITRYPALPSLKLFRISVKPARRKRSINSSM